MPTERHGSFMIYLSYYMVFICDDYMSKEPHVYVSKEPHVYVSKKRHGSFMIYLSYYMICVSGLYVKRARLYVKRARDTYIFMYHKSPIHRLWGGYGQ